MGNSKAVDVVVFGSANIEYITHVAELPKPGELVAGTYMDTCFGGKGANQCVAAAKLGASTALVAKLGKDESGNGYLNHLKHQEVNVLHVEQVKNNPTGMSEIAVSDEGQQYTINVAGANALLTAKDVSRAKKAFSGAKVLLCQLETDMNASMCAMRQFKGVSILHMSPMRKEIPAGMIALPNILVVNQEAAAQLAELEEVKTLEQAREAAVAIIEKGAKSVIITMGDQGAVYMSKKDTDMCTHVPAADVPHLADPSGAGDAFLGSLAYHIARFPKLTTEHHISAANSCAAYSVGRLGTQPSFPGKDGAKNDLCYMTPTFNVIPPPSAEAEPGENEESGETKKQQPPVVAPPPEEAPAPEPVVEEPPPPPPPEEPVAEAAPPPPEEAPVPEPVVEEPPQPPPPKEPVAEAAPVDVEEPQPVETSNKPTKERPSTKT
ncbi:LOW QUALITY PROTEIN: ribokinase [Drosophila eugracilis]|uniref:LOW QUALITY PROTEIN: ribokinase n=1 Tax=Drosophila eugracilis TaxID=29029 RepID=UPI001BDAD78D|nr:LOW QUALITY PROTEIN: ribokinase [Drosophila eugracilis]